jgi:hypothetical protein
MSENQITLPMVERKITVITSVGEKKTITTDVTVWSHLRNVLSQNGYSLSNMKALEGVKKGTLEHDDAILPVGDFKLYLMPVKSKSGAKAAKPIKKAPTKAEKKATTAKVVAKVKKAVEKLPKKEAKPAAAKKSKKAKAEEVPIEIAVIATVVEAIPEPVPEKEQTRDELRREIADLAKGLRDVRI